MAYDRTFNPDNVMLQDMKTGEIPSEHAEIILKDTMTNSAVMQLAKYEPMTKPIKNFTFLAEGPGAYWVSETEKIKTSKAKWLTAEMKAYKLGVILPVSNEFLSYSVSNFFELMAPEIAEAFYTKFDKAALFGTESPYPKGVSVFERAEKAGNIITKGTNENLYLDLNDMIASIEEADHDPNGFTTTKRFNKDLRGAVDNNNLPIFNDVRSGATASALGLPIGYINPKSMEYDKAVMLAGDWEYARYGILKGIQFKIDESATLSTITDANGESINLFERDMIALRATMTVGFTTLKEDSFAILQDEKDAEVGE